MSAHFVEVTVDLILDKSIQTCLKLFFRGEMSDITRVRYLLAEAVECLDNKSPQTSSGIRGAQSGRFTRFQGQSSSIPGPSSGIRGAQSGQFTRVQGQSSSIPGPSTSALVERNCLFNFTKRNKACSSGGIRKSKKKRLDMWTHDFVCLEKTNQAKTPTAIERATLTTMGECEYQQQVQFQFFFHLFFRSGS